MCSGRLDQRASRSAWCHAGRRDAGPRMRGVLLRASAAPGNLSHRSPVLRALIRFFAAVIASATHRAPPSCAPVFHEGDTNGDLPAGRVPSIFSTVPLQPRCRGAEVVARRPTNEGQMDLEGAPVVDRIEINSGSL